MSYGSDDFKEITRQEWEENRNRNSTMNPNRGGNQFVHAPRPDQFNGARGIEISRGNFEADNGSTIFDSTEDIEITGGTFSAKGNNWVGDRPDPRPAEMFHKAKKQTIGGGNFVASGHASAFKEAKNIKIDGGNFLATTREYPFYGSVQGNPQPSSQGPQQGKSYDPRTYSLGYPTNNNANSSEMGRAPRPEPPVRGNTFNGTYQDRTELYPPPLSAPILPSHSEGQGFSNNEGSGDRRSKTRGGGKAKKPSWK
ncbi:hypothetical protein M413DRAFT_31649 [Hebeloma cylindrosporum]|uniref:Uncharacterized protein n=1 Tax=Hebeloma cylindrosporum TaxID=76867 RepID=A0A0C3BWE7_HEBCY|nr:hypothetical protein M413DRAFT_31649 [Hebeloma cylindrosporum h7]